MASDTSTPDILLGTPSRSLSQKWRIWAGMVIGLFVVCVLIWTLWPYETYDPRFVGTWTLATSGQSPGTRTFVFDADGSMLINDEDGSAFPHQWCVTGDRLVIRYPASAPPKSLLKRSKHVARDIHRRVTGQLPLDPEPEEFHIRQINAETCLLESLPSRSIQRTYQLTLARQVD